MRLNWQFTYKRSPNVNVQRQKYLKYNLWIHSVYCTEKIRQFKEAKKERETLSTADLGTGACCPWSLTKARVLDVGPRQTSMTKSAWGSKTKPGLSSNIAASPSSLWSSTFCASPQAESPDWICSAPLGGSSPPGALALSGSRRPAWRIPAVRRQERDGDINERTVGEGGWTAGQGGEPGFHSGETEVKNLALWTPEGGRQEKRKIWKWTAEQAAWSEGRSRADKREVKCSKRPELHPKLKVCKK